MPGRSTVGRAIVRAIRGTVLTLVVLVAGLFLVWRAELPGPSPSASRSQDANDETREASAPTTASAGLSVKLDDKGQRKGGIETAPLLPATYQERAQAFGTVLALDRLTNLYNASLTADASLQAARAKASASKTANDRAQNLLKVFSTAVAQAETADSAYKVDVAGVEAAQAQIDALHNTAVQDWGPVLGQAILARSDPVSALILRKACLVQVSFQSETVRRPPQALTLDLGDGPGIEAHYVAEATQVDPKAQTAGFLYTAPVATNLAPGVSFTARVPVGAPRPGVAIPPSAVVWQGGRAWVYLKTSSDTFVRQPLAKSALTTSDGGFVVPADSLPADDGRLVTEGAQVLLSDEFRSQFKSSQDDD